MPEIEDPQELAARLTRRALPSIPVLASQGDSVILDRFTNRSIVVYTYPGSHSSPDGGEQSQAADSAQHQTFSDHEDELNAFGLIAFGLSSQFHKEQSTTRIKNRIRHELLSDTSLQLAHELKLPTFVLDDTERYRRLTLLIRNGRIDKTFFPIPDASRNIAQVLAWIRVHGA
jgi:peroxiredoxin